MRSSALVQRLEVPYEGGTLPDRWINNDIKPIEAVRRTWNFWTFHNLWVTSNVNISVYLIGSSMIAIGLTWWQAIIALVLGSFLMTLFIILNSMAGARYHIGFPVASRYVWGMYGSQFVILNRILLSFIWYSVQTWIGGQCIYVCLQAIWPNLETRIPNHMSLTSGMTTAQFVAYVFFCILSLPFIWIRPHKLQTFLWLAIAIELVFFIVLFIWALSTMGPEGFGSTITERPVSTLDSTAWTMIFGIVSTLGSIAAGILNQNDYARFAKRPGAVIHGQLASSSVYQILTGVIGILVTAATQNRFGEPLWNLPVLLSRIIETGGPRSRAAAFFAGCALIMSQLGLNVPGNALSGGFDLAATFPRFVNIRRGAYITAILSPVVNPWQLLSSASIFLNVMSSYGIFLGPMAGLMITSYYVTNQQKIAVDDLYIGNRNSIYWYTFGVDWRAVVAWTLGVAPSMPGFIAAVNFDVVVPQAWLRLYYVNFLVGFSISSVMYAGLHYVFPAERVRAFVAGPMSARDTIEFYRAKWDAVGDEVVPGVSVIGEDHGVKDRTAVSEFPQLV